MGGVSNIPLRHVEDNPNAHAHPNIIMENLTLSPATMSTLEALHIFPT